MGPALESVAFRIQLSAMYSWEETSNRGAKRSADDLRQVDEERHVAADHELPCFVSAPPIAVDVAIEKPLKVPGR